MGKALKTAGAVIGGAVLIATGVGALAGLQVTAMGIAGIGTMSVSSLQMISAGAMAVGGMLDKPKSQGAAAGSDWTSNPDQPIPFAFGRVKVAGKIVHRDEYGPDNRLQGIVSIYSGAGPIKAFHGFTADEAAVSFESNGGTAVGKYRRQMWRSWRLGDQPDTALSVPTGLDGGAIMPAWGSQYRLSGKACDLWTLQQDSKFSVYPSGEPKPLQELEGIFGYDMRYDSTYPGGLGPCRLGVRSTYRYIDNPIIAAVNWALGLTENGQVVGGIGASVNGVDLPAFADAANVADANGWKISAWPDTSEDVSVVLDQMLQAGGAVRARHAGKISCVSRGAPRPAVVTISRRDLAGAFELDTGASRFNKLNRITPRFASLEHRGDLTPANPVTFPDLETQDGARRGDQIDYRFVPAAKQAAELAAYDILDAREPFSGTAPLLPHLRRLKRGDCILVGDPDLLLDGVKLKVLSRAYDSKLGEVRIAFQSETDSKHALALGKSTTMPAYPGLTPPDPTLVTPPAVGDWIVIPRQPGEDGVEVPIIDVVGEVSNATATEMIVEWAPPPDPPPPDPLPEPEPGQQPVQWSDYLDWSVAYAGPPTTKQIAITGLQPGQQYYVAVTYRRAGNSSLRTVLPGGPFTAPNLSIPGASSDTTPPAVPTGVALSSAVVANATTGEPEVTITATWTANTEGDLAGYEVEVSQGGNSIIDAAGTNRYARTARSGAVYGIRVRAYDKAGNRSAWTVQQNVIGGLDTVPPSPPTAISANVSLGAFFLRWTAPADSDVAAVEVYESTSNTSVGAQLVATVPALPSAQSGVTISRPTGSIRWFFLRAVDTSKNKSAFTASVTNTIPSINGATDLIARSIVADNIALGTLTGDLIQTQTLTTDKLAVTGALPVGLTVGPGGATLQTIQTRANDPAARVNENTTRIEPGLVSVGGGQNLFHWKTGPNTTEINGGAIGANTITANKLEIGARGLMIDRFNFRTQGNVLTWDGGRITWTDDSGASVTTGVGAGSYTYSAAGGDITYIFWAKGQGVLQATKSAGLAMNAGTVVLGAYYGGRLFTASYGRTIIDETGIITPSLAAITGTMGTLTAGRVQSSDGNTFLDLIASRAQFRVAGYDWRQGSLGSGVVCWFGPTSVPIGSETRTNGVWAFGTDGKVYYGNAELGGAALTASVSPQTAFGSRPGGGSVSTNTLTLTLSGPGAATATVRWVKSDETWTGPNRVNDNIFANIGNNGRSISFGGIAPVGGLAAATYLAVVTANGQSTTVVADVQLSDSN